jgi:hypothetical protein
MIPFKSTPRMSVGSRKEKCRGDEFGFDIFDIL